jgi:glycosyltransferase involved in cell wall biosynthesis
VSISACLIVKNNANILADCLESFCKHVDEIVIVDSNSTDKTKEVAYRYTDKVYDFNDPEAYLTDDQALYDKLKIKGKPTNQRFLADYSKARNFSFSKATSDYIMWLDSDDIVKNPEDIRNLVRFMTRDRVKAVRVNYDYSFDKYGKPISSFFRERIVKNTPEVKWIYPGHEVLDCSGVVGEYPTFLNIEHRNHSGGNVARKIEHKAFKILKNYVLDSDLVDARIYFYLGREATGVSVDESITAFESYLKVGWWDEEMALARASIGCIFEDLGDYNKAWNYYAGALMTFDRSPDGYLGLARVAYYKQMWDKCIHFTTLGLNTPFKGALWTASYSYGRENPYVFSNVAYSKLGKNKEALDHCLKGIEVDPDNKSLIYNKAFYEKHLAGIAVK